MNDSIYCRFETQQYPESLWRDFQRWRETLGLLVLAEVDCKEGEELSKAITDAGIYKKYFEICETNKMVLNSTLIIIPSTSTVSTKSFDNELAYLAFCNKNNEYDLQKPLYDFLGTIVEKITQEANNFADSKNEGLIITLADINIDEGFTTLKNRRN